MVDEPEVLAQYASAAEQRGKSFARNAVLNQTETFFFDELGKKCGNS